jgi:hypothetical protein
MQAKSDAMIPKRVDFSSPWEISVLVIIGRLWAIKPIN